MVHPRRDVVRMHLSLYGRVALVTGAAQGIGRAIARAFLDAGASVHLADIDRDGVEATAAALSAPAHVVDLGDRDAAHALVSKIAARKWPA